MISAWIGWVACVGIAAAPVADATRIDALIKQLGDPSFRVRDAATRELLEIGPPAKRALKKAELDPDPEVRARCAFILPRILVLDLKLRIDKFLADPDSEDVQDLPGLHKYREMVGDKQPARELYAEMVKHHGEWMEKIATDPRQAAQRYREFVAEYYNRHRVNGVAQTANLILPTDSADLAVFFFLGSDPVTRGGELPYIQVSNILRYRMFLDAVNSREADSLPIRPLFVKWAEQQTHVTIQTRILTLANTSEIKELLPFAVKLIKEPVGIVRVKAYAAMVVGKFGTKEHLPILERMFDNEGVLTTVRFGDMSGTVQLRDVMLAMSIQLVGDKLEGYGFDLLNTNPISVVSYYQLGFSSEEKREAAFRKWREQTK